MINRRGALAAIGAAAFGGVEWLISKGQRLRAVNAAQVNFKAFGAELVNQSGDTLSADLARLGARVYSEEGIPMFLACENVGAAARTSGTHMPVPSELNKKVGTAFQRYAGEWQHVHPDAPASDVARLVELLADRDLASGGTEASL